MELLDTTATVETPERVRFRYRLAGPGQRAVAWFIDVCIRIVVLAVLAAVSAILFVIPDLGYAGVGLLMVAWFVLEWFYGVAFETALAGRTPGKMVLSLRVVREDGSPGQFPDFLLRNLMRGVDFLPALFGVGVVTMLVDGRLRRLGDLVGGTVVVAEERTSVLGEVTIQPPVSEEERQSLPPRVDLTREEVGIIEEFLRRRPRLSDDRAEELAFHFGPALSERTGVRAPTWERVLTLAYARSTGKDR